MWVEKAHPVDWKYSMYTVTVLSFGVGHFGVVVWAPPLGHSPFGRQDIRVHGQLCVGRLGAKP